MAVFQYKIHTATISYLTITLINFSTLYKFTVSI